MGCGNSKAVSDADSPRNNNSSKMEAKKDPDDSSRSTNADSHRYSLKLDTSADPNVSIKTLTFRHVMKDPLGREYFMNFLKIEHAEENLIFFEVRKMLSCTILVNIIFHIIFRPHHHIFRR